MKEKNSGITLIALIITIIVMLILVAVTITMAVNGGLFGYAGNATRDTKTAMEDEKNLVDVESGLSTDELIATYTGQELPKPAYSATLLDENGVLTKNAIYTDTNSNKTAEIPKGFGIVEDFNIINQGLVISDKFDSNGNSIGNEFVWIPVVFTAEGDEDENGLDDAFEAVFYRSRWQNNARKGNYATSTDYIENASNDPTGKYNEMMLSVQEHKGFYIGRYEAGELENGKIVVKRDKRPFTNVKWGDSMTSVGTTGAVYYSRNMYTDEDHNVTSTLCYSIQWDTVLDFVKDENHNVTSSANWGNYSDTNADIWKITRRTAEYYNYQNSQWTAITADLTKESVGNVRLTTGANDNFQSKNIYDIAGNVYEWMMEAYRTTGRIHRSASYGRDALHYSANTRESFSPDLKNIAIGFRPALYL